MNKYRITTPVYIESKKSGYANPKCYLSFTNGCSEKISGEHYISKSLLKLISKHKNTVEISGLPWIPRGHLRTIGISSLVSNILCDAHNPKLSPLDAEVQEFVSSIFSIDENFQSNNPANNKYYIDGTYIERWIMKMIVGIIQSNQGKQSSGQPLSYKKKIIDIICSSRTLCPSGWGLYFSDSGVVHHSSSFEFIPKFNADNGEVLALTLKFNGFEMNFLMGKPNNTKTLGILRPQKMIFAKDNIKSEIYFDWRNNKAGKDILYSHVGLYKGDAPGHNLQKI